MRAGARSAPAPWTTSGSVRSSRSAARTRSASLGACTTSWGCRSGCRRRSTMTSRARTTRSASGRPCRSPPTPSTACTTGESHDRVIVVEVMGRHAGWIALESGSPAAPTRYSSPSNRRRWRPSASGSSAARARPQLCDRGGQRRRGARGRSRGGVRSTSSAMRSSPRRVWARRSPARHGRDRREARAVVLGHVQRGGTPRVRPRAGHALRREGRRYGRRGRLREDGRAPRRPALGRLPRRGRQPAQDGPEQLWQRFEEVVSGP